MAVAVERDRIRTCLREFDFRRLFIEELGWDRYQTQPPQVTAGGETYTLQPVAQKKGFSVLLCMPDAQGGIPDYTTRRKIETQVGKLAHEHLIIYADRDHTMQVWQWVKRQQGQTALSREQRYFAGQTGEALVQRLRQFAIDISDEDTLTILGVTEKVAAAFDVDRVTKRFYDRFKTEHAAFLGAIAGIADDEQRAWYASLMLNRLMFTYFVQKKGFLAGDENYLPNRLAMVRAQYGSGKFHSFYSDFLLRFFHGGLGRPKAARSPELAELIGDIPYVNGGLFEMHQIEAGNQAIAIPDEAFERIFTFFDAYQWHLDERPLRADNEINPDVLGYIFEKYINQKQMGAYYTKEDITGYIGRNTIVPYLLDTARNGCSVAFAADGEVWRLLRDDPDRYIYDAVRHGVDDELPPEIAAGIGDVAKRGGWNRPAPAPFALLTETWREHIARRTRCHELRAKLAAGEVTEINDLITYNLDIERFARDVIERCEGPELLRAVWKALTGVTVLDPTCGSGAFLFAALNILEPLYEACLDRMRAFVAGFERAEESRKGEDFRKLLESVRQHPNRRYYVLKTIIVNNLYGVDIMEEACEIAKLRLFLKLVAQVGDVRQLEPLPDIDFNIRAGNTLVGFATLDAVRQAMMFGPRGQMKMLSEEDEATLRRIDEGAENADRAFEQFRAQQTTHGGEITHAHKAELQRRLGELRGELDGYLAREYGVDPADLFAYGPWRKSHQPFHWFVEFYGIVHKRGGFDVIIGNPPYVEYAKVKGEYSVRHTSVESCGNLYAFVVERSINLLGHAGRCGMIVPVSLLCTERMVAVQRFLFGAADTWASSYDMRPSALFSGVSQRLTIFAAHATTTHPNLYFGGYRRWNEQERSQLLEKTTYVRVPVTELRAGYAPKISTANEATIDAKLRGSPITSLEAVHGETIYTHRIVRYFVKAVNFVPHFWNEVDGVKKSEDYKPFTFREGFALAMAACLNSSTFYWFWRIYSDGFHCGYRDARALGLSHALAQGTVSRLTALAEQLMNDFQRHAVRRVAYSKATGRMEYDELYPKLSKPIIDEIDRVLAEHYGFTEEELDFIINYDIKYRMGTENGESESGDEGE